MRAKMTLAEALSKGARAVEAVAVRQEALVMARSMVRRDQSNAQWKRWLDRIEREMQNKIGE